MPHQQQRHFLLICMATIAAVVRAHQGGGGTTSDGPAAAAAVDCEKAAHAPQRFESIDAVQRFIADARRCPGEFFAAWLASPHGGPPSKADEGLGMEERLSVWLGNLDFIFRANAGPEPAGLAPNHMQGWTMREAVASGSGLLNLTAVLEDQRRRAARREEEEEEGRASGPGAPEPAVAGGSGNGSSHSGGSGVSLRRSLAASTAWAAPPAAAQQQPLPLPASFDWRARGLTFFPGNQGTCNSCYAFTTSQLVSNLLQMAGDPLGARPLSVQDILDCCTEPGCWFGNRGCPATSATCGPCEAGWPHSALRWVSANGLVPEAAAAYVPELNLAWDGSLPPEPQCASRPGAPSVAARIDYADTTDLHTLVTEEELKAMLMQSPVIIGMNNADDNFRFAGPGHTVLQPADGPLDAINHAVLLVGYGTHPTGGPYWLVLNSYGDAWGEGGFGRLARTPDDPWHVLDYAVTARLAPSVKPRCLVPRCAACREPGEALQPLLSCAACEPGYLPAPDAEGFYVCIGPSSLSSSAAAANGGINGGAAKGYPGVAGIGSGGGAVAAGIGSGGVPGGTATTAAATAVTAASTTAAPAPGTPLASAFPSSSSASTTTGSTTSTTSSSGVTSAASSITITAGNG